MTATPRAPPRTRCTTRSSTRTPRATGPDCSSSSARGLAQRRAGAGRRAPARAGPGALGVDAEEEPLVRTADMSVAGRNPGRIIGTVLSAFVREHTGRRVRIIGEPIWAGRSTDEYPACAEHEALINVALGSSPAYILCPYDVTHLDRGARRRHPHPPDAGRRAATAGPAPATPTRRPWPPPSTGRWPRRRDADVLVIAPDHRPRARPAGSCTTTRSGPR